MVSNEDDVEEPDVAEEGGDEAGGGEPGRDDGADGGEPVTDDGGEPERLASESDDRPTPGADEHYCSSCGAVIKKEAEICPECGVRQSQPAASSSKDRVTAGILALLLGGLGAHKFYLGETGLGLLYLCFSWTFIPAIVGFIEGILYLTKTDEEFQRKYVND